MTDHSETPWTALSSRPIYTNPWISVREDVVRMPDGRTTVYGVITCKDAVGILPFVDDDTVLLVRQYRYVTRRVTWEMPTGGAHPGETQEAAAQRELAEEIGHRADRLVHVCTFHTSKSVVDETAHLFLGYGLAPAAVARDETEFIATRAFPFEEALAMVLSGEIVDAMTIIAVLHAARLRSAGP
jgi:ADP-ribose pyrophosphatase